VTKLTVILPCAGAGTRLNLPFSKELFSIEKNKCLIDYSFDLFSSYARDDINFVVTINENKTDLVRYLGKYKHKFNISFTYFNPTEVDVPGSVRSARHLFSKNNIVLLPDTILRFKSGFDIKNTICTELSASSFIFLYKEETSQAALSARGALNVIDDKVVDYEDKPQYNVDRFNAFWCALAFKKEIFDEAFNIIQLFYTVDSCKPLIKETVLYGAKAIQIDSYSDLGTWENIYNHIQHI
jgi:NDP-sugar pyrophosphorylase family protein